ncbi:MAG: LysR family transcriptional regulator [Deltaproteobacteria bacterium]|nr:LysR family transcriptional regulator [Deltaproteobacteria bacterium]MBK8240647.1 LysR family transcriptional regulator [Deltaproteobacteria bacterium]MBK8718078.1 LysR family transcriptional regulator [Deltaproteobacteria bacterium]MBP7288511.1 LysR family transcriptional regulator [Nannocystaceae bacterium]
MPIDLDTVRAFVHVAEQGGFTRAAAKLGVPKARVSQQVQRLEADVGARLLHRTTRAVRLTPDGETFLARARPLLLEAEELSGLFAADEALAGRVRVDLPVGLARNAVIPRLPELLARHPRLELQLSTTDRLVDVVREGFDAVVRVAKLRDSGLVALRLGELELVNCAAASYLRARGIPRTLQDLDDHTLVNYAADLGSGVPEFEYHDGHRHRVHPMRAAITVNNADAFSAACDAGLGIVQVPRTGVAERLASGALVEVLPRHRAAPLPVFLLHPHGRRVPRRVRAVLDWLEQILRAHLRRFGRARPAASRSSVPASR